jgi:hypothetical protein
LRSWDYLGRQRSNKASIKNNFMKYLVYSLIISLFLLSCSKEKSTQYIATLTNTTTHKITILFYKGGIVFPTDTIKLFTNQPYEIANGFDRGRSSTPGFSSKYFGGPNDSIVVVFDNIYKVSHYADAPVNLARKYYLFSSLRNIGNPKSYRFELTEEKNGNVKKHFYDFIEQDYLDAK